MLKFSDERNQEQWYVVKIILEKNEKKVRMDVNSLTPLKMSSLNKTLFMLAISMLVPS